MRRRMIILDSLLIGGLKFVFDKIATAVDEEMNDEGSLREELLAAQMRVELGEMERERFRGAGGPISSPACARSATPSGASPAAPSPSAAASRWTSPSGETRNRRGTASSPPPLRRQGGRRQDDLRRRRRSRRAEAGPPRPRRLHRSRPLPRRRPAGAPHGRAQRAIATRRGTLLAAELAAGPALGRWMAEHRGPAARDRRARHLPGRRGRRALPRPLPPRRRRADGLAGDRPAGAARPAATRSSSTPPPPPTPCACSPCRRRCAASPASSTASRSATAGWPSASAAPGRRTRATP